MTIKSLELKQNQIKMAPELYLKKTYTLLDDIVFEQGNKPLSVPSARLSRLPRWDPVADKHLANYLSMDNLINEMLHIKIQYKLDEASFVSLLVSQFSTEAKNFMRSVLGTHPTIGTNS